MNISLLILLWIVALIALIYGLWNMIPALTGLPWIPTDEDRIRKALEMAQLRPGEIVYDLGAGDGRVLIIAAREYGAQAVGIEASPLQWFFAWIKVLHRGSKPKVRVRLGNLFRTNLREADVVFTYMTSKQADRLRPLLEEQLRPGARVVTISFDLGDWQPTAFDNDELIFLYEMPPKPGGLAAYLAKQD